MDGAEKVQFENMQEALADLNAIAALQETNSFYHTLTRDICTVTRLEASNKINVVPTVAIAETDCRMLPDRASADLLRDIEDRLKGTGVTTEVLMALSMMG